MRRYTNTELRNIVLVDGPDIVYAADCVDDPDIVKWARKLKRDIDYVRDFGQDQTAERLRALISDLADLAKAIWSDADQEIDLADIFSVAAQYRQDQHDAEQRRQLGAKQLTLGLR